MSDAMRAQNCMQDTCEAILKTLFNIVEARFKTLLNFDVCVVWWCSDGYVNSQDYKSSEMYAVTIKISMTEYYHSINCQADGLF